MRERRVEQDVERAVAQARGDEAGTHDGVGGEVSGRQRHVGSLGRRPAHGAPSLRERGGRWSCGRCASVDRVEREADEPRAGRGLLGRRSSRRSRARRAARLVLAAAWLRACDSTWLSWR